MVTGFRGTGWRDFDPTGIVVRVHNPHRYVEHGVVYLDPDTLELAPNVEQNPIAKGMPAHNCMIEEITPPHLINANLNYPADFTTAWGKFWPHLMGTFNCAAPTPPPEHSRPDDQLAMGFFVPMTSYFSTRLHWRGAWFVMLMEPSMENPLAGIVLPSVEFPDPSIIHTNGTVRVLNGGEEVSVIFNLSHSPHDVRGTVRIFNSVHLSTNANRTNANGTTITQAENITRRTVVTPPTTREYLVAYIPQQTRGFHIFRDVQVLNADRVRIDMGQLQATQQYFAVNNQPTAHFLQYRNDGVTRIIPMPHGTRVVRLRELTVPQLVPNLVPTGRMALLTDFLSAHATPDVARAVRQDGRMLRGEDMNRVMQERADLESADAEPYTVGHRYYAILKFILRYRRTWGLITQVEMDRDWGLVEQYILSKCRPPAPQQNMGGGMVEEIQMCQAKIQSVEILRGHLPVAQLEALLAELNGQLDALQPSARLQREVDRLEVDLLVWGLGHIPEQMATFRNSWGYHRPSGNERGPPLEPCPRDLMRPSLQSAPLCTRFRNLDDIMFEDGTLHNGSGGFTDAHSAGKQRRSRLMPYLIIDQEDLTPRSEVEFNPNIWRAERLGRLMATLSSSEFNLREKYCEIMRPAMETQRTNPHPQLETTPGGAGGAAAAVVRSRGGMQASAAPPPWPASGAAVDLNTTTGAGTGPAARGGRWQEAGTRGGSIGRWGLASRGTGGGFLGSGGAGAGMGAENLARNSDVADQNMRALLNASSITRSGGGRGDNSTRLSGGRGASEERSVGGGPTTTQRREPPSRFGSGGPVSQNTTNSGYILHISDRRQSSPGHAGRGGGGGGGLASPGAGAAGAAASPPSTKQRQRQRAISDGEIEIVEQPSPPRAAAMEEGGGGSDSGSGGREASPTPPVSTAPATNAPASSSSTRGRRTIASRRAASPLVSDIERVSMLISDIIGSVTASAMHSKSNRDNWPEKFRVFNNELMDGHRRNNMKTLLKVILDFETIVGWKALSGHWKKYRSTFQTVLSSRVTTDQIVHELNEFWRHFRPEFISPAYQPRHSALPRGDLVAMEPGGAAASASGAGGGGAGRRRGTSGCRGGGRDFSEAQTGGRAAGIRAQSDDTRRYFIFSRKGDSASLLPRHFEFRGVCTISNHCTCFDG